MTRKVQSEKI